MTLGKVLALLPTLDKEELSAVRLATINLLGKTAATYGETANFYNLIYQETFEGAGLRLPSFNMLSPTLVNQLEASLDLINVFINKNAPSVTKGQRRVLYRVFVRALYSWLIEADIPVNSKTLITNLDKLPGIVDRAFPGYIQAGLLGAIVSLRNKPTGYEEQE